MNGRIPAAILLAAGLAASTHALGQAKAPRVVPGPVFQARITHTCANPNPGFVFLQQDGGYQETAQGWFYKAEVHQSTSWAFAYCYYGLDKASPANRPVYTVHYEMTGFKSNECSVAGAVVTCSRLAVLSPQ